MRASSSAAQVRAPRPEAPRRVLILMADTGGGHRAAARAITEALAQRLGPAIDARWLDPLAAARWPLPGFAPGYAFVAQRLPRLYGWSWHRSDGPRSAARMHAALHPWLRPVLRQAYADAEPDLVVSVHPLLTHGPLRILREGGWTTPFATVVTDLVDAHATWFGGPPDLLIAPTEAVAARARRLGLPEARLRVLGQPIRPCFASSPPRREAARAALGLPPELPLVLLLGGGDGLGRLPHLARAISELATPLQLAVVTGRNRRLAERLRRERWPIPVHVTGFVENLADWMQAAELAVTKAGPGTIMEALAAGLPLILHDHLPGQEEGNVRLVLESGLGRALRRPPEVAHLVERWLDPQRPERLRELQDRARAAGRPRAALDIAQALVDLLEAGGTR